jgi:hypothetical protein
MDTRIGKVTHYFNHLSVAVLELTGELKVGEAIHILGRITDFDQHVGSLEVEHHKIQSAGPGAAVALKVIEPVRPGDIVFKCVGD